MFYDFIAVYYVNACIGYILSWPVWLVICAVKSDCIMNM